MSDSRKTFICTEGGHPVNDASPPPRGRGLKLRRRVNMAKTAAEKQAAYRERKAEQLSEESPEAIARAAIDPVIPGSPGIESLDEIMSRINRLESRVLATLTGKLDKIIGMLNHLLLPKAITPPPVFKEPATNETSPPGPGMTSVKDLSKCPECGKDLPPVETPRRWSEPCQACVWKNAEKRTA